MTKTSCPIPSPDQRKFVEIQQAAERHMLDKVIRAINDAAIEVGEGLKEAGLELEPTSREYFMFAVQQMTFVRLCGGDADTLQGGDPEIGQRIVNNGQGIIDSYWKANGHQSTRKREKASDA